MAHTSLATNRWSTAGGEEGERTDWHRLTFFGRLADIVEQWVKKGDKLYVEGRLEYSQTQDEQGGTLYWTDIVVNEMVMLGGGGGTGGEDASEGGSWSGGGQSFGGSSAPSAPSGPASPPDDDLPF